MTPRTPKQIEIWTARIVQTQDLALDYCVLRKIVKTSTISGNCLLMDLRRRENSVRLPSDFSRVLSPVNSSSVSHGRGPQSDCSRRGYVLGRSGVKMDSKSCHGAD